LNKQLQIQIFIKITKIKKDTTKDVCLFTPLHLHQMQSNSSDAARILNVNIKYPRERGRREGERGKQRETLTI